MSIQSIIAELEGEIEREKKVYAYISSRRSELVEGSLSIHAIKNDMYYYQTVYINGKKIYIILDRDNDEHRKIIKELMEKKTIIHGGPILRKNIKAMEKCRSAIRPYTPTAFQYGELLGPDYYLDDEVCLREWAQKPDRQNPYHPENLIFETKSGIIVRSKSEALIADILYDNGVEFKYEMELRSGGKILYPDFGFIHPKSPRIIWWEHLGMVDVPDYSVKAFEKQDDYGRIDIFPGNNLILTWETRERPLTRSIIEEKLKQYGII